MLINELKNIGIGSKCLIIGGGLSVLNFEFSKSAGMTIIAVNDSLSVGVKVDYLIYNDAQFLPKLNKLNEQKKLEGIKIICNRNYPSKIDSYQYWLDDFASYGFTLADEDNTGLKAIIIAKYIMNFDSVYLIGFDYCTKVIDGREQSHFIGDLIGKDEKYIDDQQVRDHFKRLAVMVNQFDIFRDTKGIYNLNKDSKLKKFEYIEL